MHKTNNYFELESLQQLLSRNITKTDYNLY